MKPILTIAKIAPAGKVFALAVPVQRAGLTGFSILAGAGMFTLRSQAETKRGKYPPAARVTVVLIDAPKDSHDHP